MSTGRFCALTAGAGTALALALTWPLVGHLDAAVLDDGSLDAFQFLWNLWWVKHSLAAASNPFYTHHLYYPEGVGLLFHTLSFPLGLASIPLQLTIGLVPAHNVLVLAAPALTVLAVGLLAREVSGDGWAGLAAGLMVALNASAVWFLPVLYLDCTYLLGFVLWGWLRLQRTRRPRWIAGEVVLVAILLFTAQEYAVMALALLALDTMGRLLAPRLLGLDRPWVAGTVAFWGAAALGLGALAAAAAGQPAEPPPPSQVQLASGYALGFVSPTWLHPPTVRFWSILYLGTAPLLALVPALALGRRPTRYWLLALAAMLLMVLGPSLHLTHPLGPDMNTAPARLGEGAVPGPYHLATILAPMLRYFRAPYRWMTPAHIALAVVVACGFAGLRSRLAPGRLRRVVTVLPLAAVPLLATLDVRGLRAPLVDARIPIAGHLLQADPEPAAVLELPSGLGRSFGLMSSRWMFHQTAHGKYLLEGTVARLPAGHEPVVERTIRSFEDLPYVKYVVLHRDALFGVLPESRRQVAEIEALLEREGERITPPGRTEIHRLRTFRPTAVRPRP